MTLQQVILQHQHVNNATLSRDSGLHCIVNIQAALQQRKQQQQQQQNKQITRLPQHHQTTTPSTKRLQHYNINKPHQYLYTINSFNKPVQYQQINMNRLHHNINRPQHSFPSQISTVHYSAPAYCLTMVRCKRVLFRPIHRPTSMGLPH